MSLTEGRPTFRQSLLHTEPSANGVFDFVCEHVGTTGWELVCLLGHPPTALEQVLSDLVQADFLRADGYGLEAYYAPSLNGYRRRLRMNKTV